MNCRINNILSSMSTLRKVGFIVLSLFFLIVFESKALINIIGSLLLLLALAHIYFCDKKILKNNHYLLLFLGVYCFGFLLSFFSESGAIGALGFLDRFKFILILVPLTTFIKKKEELNFLLLMFFTSAIVAICYGIYDKQPYSDFRGFYKIGRTADMMVVACLAALVCLIQSKFIFNIKVIAKQFIMLVITSFFLWAIMMSEMRGAWLGLCIGVIIIIFILFLLERKLVAISFLITILIGASIVFFLNIGGHTNRITNQIESVVATNNNESNEARLNLWKTGWDFSKDHFLFGTGAKQSEKMFVEFFNSQTIEYQNKYHYAINYPSEFHNSYMQIYVESGVVFLFLYITTITYILLSFLKSIDKVHFIDQKYLMAAFVSSIAFLFIQFFHSELYSFGSVAFYFMLFSGCYILNQWNSMVWKRQ